MKYIQAEIVVTNTGSPLRNAIVGYDGVTGVIHAVYREGETPEVDAPIEQKKGVLIPGYINAHCHLELSHLKNVIPTGTGLVEFIKRVIQLRLFPQEEVEKAISKADEEMAANGIVAVGDISNTADTLDTKVNSKIKYRTFVEAFDLFQENQTNDTFKKYLEVYEQFEKAFSKSDISMVPHAPYSVSQDLFGLLEEVNPELYVTSIHNQEVAAENQLFQKGNGPFIDFYKSMEFTANTIPVTGKNSLNYALENMNPAQQTLLVHNTQTNAEDIEAAHDWSPNVYWVTCPNANLYIEDKLPDYRVLLQNDAKMCVGTDSLSSNWELSVYEEIRTIKTYQPNINDIDLIKWATVNGAEALGYDDLGRIKEGTSPGLNLIEVEVRDGVFDLREAKGSTKIV